MPTTKARDYTEIYDKDCRTERPSSSATDGHSAPTRGVDAFWRYLFVFAVSLWQRPVMRENCAAPSLERRNTSQRMWSP